MDEIDPQEFDESSKPAPPRRKTMRERANEPSDTVGVGTSAAVGCSLLAVLLTAVLIAGLLISRAF
jgi:hypothetical protein